MRFQNYAKAKTDEREMVEWSWKNPTETSRENPRNQEKKKKTQNDIHFAGIVLSGNNFTGKQKRLV